MFKKRFWITLEMPIPVVFFSPMVGYLFGYTPPHFPGSLWIAPILGTDIFCYGGQPFLKGGWQEIKARQPGMMLLISMTITVAFITSWVTSLGIGGFDLDFWWELALLVVIMLLGHWIEMGALGSARGALDALAALLPDEAKRIIDGGAETISIPELVVGDIVLVRSGDPVVAGTVATDSSLRLPPASYVHRLVPARQYPGCGTVTVLVIACPHALGLAIPLVIAVSTELAGS